MARRHEPLTVAAQEALAEPVRTTATAPDETSRRWLERLGSERRSERDDAVAELHALLLRAARFEVHRRRAALPHAGPDERADLALEAADDAVVAVLGRLGDYRGLSRFTTWAYKFALLEAAVKVRRRAWQGREVPWGDDPVELLARGRG